MKKLCALSLLVAFGLPLCAMEDSNRASTPPGAGGFNHVETPDCGFKIGELVQKENKDILTAIDTDGLDVLLSSMSPEEITRRQQEEHDLLKTREQQLNAEKKKEKQADICIHDIQPLAFFGSADLQKAQVNAINDALISQEKSTEVVTIQESISQPAEVDKKPSILIDSATVEVALANAPQENADATLSGIEPAKEVAPLVENAPSSIILAENASLSKASTYEELRAQCEELYEENIELKQTLELCVGHIDFPEVMRPEVIKRLMGEPDLSALIFAVRKENEMISAKLDQRLANRTFQDLLNELNALRQSNDELKRIGDALGLVLEAKMIEAPESRQGKIFLLVPILKAQEINKAFSDELDKKANDNLKQARTKLIEYHRIGAWANPLASTVTIAAGTSLLSGLVNDDSSTLKWALRGTAALGSYLVGKELRSREKRTAFALENTKWDIQTRAYYLNKVKNSLKKSESIDPLDIAKDTILTIALLKKAS